MEEKLIDRIGDEYLNPNFQDGQILLNSDINEIVSIVKEGINANFNDIQKIQNGSHQVGNSKQLDGADLSRFSDGEMVGSDKLIPTSQQVKSYVDTKVQEIKDTTEVGKLVEDINALGVEVGNKVDKTDLVNEETTGGDKAYNCDYINELFENGVGDSLPIGTIVEYTGENIPDGFEEVIEPEDATVYVGPNEPTGGQDIWIQKSVNILNKNNPLIVHAYPDGNTKSWIFDNNGYSFVVEIESNSEYTITKPSGANIFNISTSTSVPTSGGSATNLVDGANNEIHIRSGANDKYLIGYFAWSSEVIDVASLLNGIQVQKGSIATEYEPFVERKIFVRNQNGAYEEFVNVTSLNALIPQRRYIVVNPEYVYDGDLQYMCFKVGNIVFLNIGSIAFKKELGHENVLASKLPIPKEYYIGYLFGGQNALGAEGSIRVAVNLYGDMVVHYGGTSIFGDSANKQFNGTIIYETID